MYTINVIRVIHILIDLAIYFDYLNIIRLIIYPIANHINTPIHTHTHIHGYEPVKWIKKTIEHQGKNVMTSISISFFVCNFFFVSFQDGKKYLL